MVEHHNTSSGGEDDFAALFEESLKREDIKEGDIVHGRVIQLNKDHVVVDIGYKSEGQVPLEEFRSADGTVGVKEGDEVDVFLESRENDIGLCVLSKEKADRLKVWDEICAACERDELIEGVITARVKGGLSVTIRGGVKAFLPGLAGRPAPGAQPRRVPRQELQVQGHQVQQEARQHRAVAPRAPREGARRAQGVRRSRSSRKARSSRASSRTSPSTARSSTSAASTACCTSPT